MEFLSAIVIPDDEESGPEQSHSRPLRASRSDYSYRDWEGTMDDAGVTASPAHKRKRLTGGESIASILV